MNKINSRISQTNHKIKNKLEYSNCLFAIILVLFSVVILSTNANAQTLTCEELAALPFSEATSYPSIIDQAVICGFKLTNEQFKIASTEMQEMYVLSINADFTFEEQSSVFIRTILKENTEINEATSPSVKSFLTYNENYSFKENQTNLSVKDVFKKVANKSINTINEINTDGQNNIAYLRYFNETSYFIYVNAAFDYYENSTEIFVSNGPQSTIFTMKDIKYFEMQGYSEFFMESDGRLKAKKYQGKEICTDCNYYISPDGKTINVQSGQINLNDKSFTSDSPYVINVKENNAYEVVGSNIIGVNPESSEVIFKANGKISVLTEDHYVLGENTKYAQYQNNKQLFDITTEKDTDLFTTNNPVKISTFDYGDAMPEGAGDVTFESEETEGYSPCDNIKNSCVYWNPATNGIDVRLKENTLAIKDDNAIVSYLDVAQIKGKDSSFSYYNNGGILKCTESGVTETGDHQLFPSYTVDITEDGKQYEIISGSSSISTCASPCTSSGSIKKKKETPAQIVNLPVKPSSKVDAVMVIAANPFEGINKMNTSKLTTISGLYVQNTVQSGLLDYNKQTGKSIAFFETSEKYTPLKTSTEKYTMTGKEYYKLDETQQVNDPRYKNMVVIITGHHGTGRGMNTIYGEHYYFQDELKNDDLQFSRGLTTPASQELFDLKYNENVYVVMFSACQTVKMPYSFNDEKQKYDIAVYPKNAIKDLTKAYPNLRLIIGYDNIAPGVDLIYNTKLNRGINSNSNLLNNPSDTGLIDFTILENSGFEAFGDKAADIYKVDLTGLAKYRQAHPEEEAYADRYANGKRIAYYYKDTDGKWYFHTNYAYDKSTNTWSRKEVTLEVKPEEGFLIKSEETTAILTDLNS